MPGNVWEKVVWPGPKPQRNLLWWFSNMKNQDPESGNISRKQGLLRKQSRLLLSFLGLHAVAVSLKIEKVESSMTDRMFLCAWVQHPKFIQVLCKIDWILNLKYTFRKQSGIILFRNTCLLVNGHGFFRKKLEYLIVECIWHWEQCMQQILPLCPAGGQPCLSAQ